VLLLDDTWTTGSSAQSAAIALRRAGVEATVYERAEDVTAGQLGAGLGLAYNATRVLRRIGLLEPVQEVAATTKHFEFRNWKGRLLSQWTVPEGEVQLGVTRKALHRVLVDSVPADALVAGKTCVRFDQDDSSATASFEDGTTAHGELLIGADGLRSTVRAQIHGEEAPRYAGFSVLRTVVPVTDDDSPLPAGVFRLLWGPGACFGMYHVGSGVVYIFGWQREKEGVHLPRGRRKETFVERFRGWSPEAVALIERSDESAIHQTDIYDRPPVHPWGEGRVSLAGDAAHAMTFNMGQGACQGMEDAPVLARALQADGQTPAALRAYESERRERADQFTKNSARVAKMSIMRGPASAIRNVLLKGVGKRISRGEQLLMIDV
jgi:2-polyprenyl-6-methoxyphenol hydroxylase-like FAD-dependent oxidoreductase